MGDIIAVRVCRGCLKVKRFDEWVKQSEELVNEIREGRIKVLPVMCPTCCPK